MKLDSQALSQDLLRGLYARPDEQSADDVRRRIATALSQAEPEPTQTA